MYYTNITGIVNREIFYVVPENKINIKILREIFCKIHTTNIYNYKEKNKDILLTSSLIINKINKELICKVENGNIFFNQKYVKEFNRIFKKLHLINGYVSVQEESNFKDFKFKQIIFESGQFADKQAINILNDRMENSGITILS